ncbi:rhodanese-like domain-containing protein [Antarcticibacterium sp. 1MA-6-2]|uniref:rhodanese-like domain-containing protein n=1 Tax=Antarcticibacterium sp. 1MA-6-2 TaxID=2908210 RepID=UPI001F38FE45|nr:rhodanese-like domain-containing protein [Antarcticibacterium sp. 1MA-6-2]UJH91137.1 rhodanese-like domain-containing protein [Antarcticibacterium sp. 1MA-6-2]
MKILKLIVGLALVISCGSCKDAAATDIHTVTPAEMQNHLKYDDNVQVVDVQPEEEYQKSHLLNARNIIYDKDFRKKLDKLDKSRPVALYCTTGKVSPEAAQILKDAGFLHIYVLEGGIKKWRDDTSENGKK